MNTRIDAAKVPLIATMTIRQDADMARFYTAVVSAVEESDPGSISARPDTVSKIGYGKEGDPGSLAAEKAPEEDSSSSSTGTRVSDTVRRPYHRVITVQINRATSITAVDLASEFLDDLADGPSL